MRQGMALQQPTGTWTPNKKMRQPAQALAHSLGWRGG